MQKEKEKEERGWIVKAPHDAFSLLVSRYVSPRDRQEAFETASKELEVSSCLPRDLARIVAAYAPCLRQFLVSHRKRKIVQAILAISPLPLLPLMTPWLRARLLQCTYRYDAVARVAVRCQYVTSHVDWSKTGKTRHKTLIAVTHALPDQDEDEDVKLSVTHWTFDSEDKIDTYEIVDKNIWASIPGDHEIQPGEALACYNDILFFGSHF